MSDAQTQPRGKDTYQLVQAAADDLLRQGRGHEITTRNLLEIIGQGSTTTIQKALEGWWQDAGGHLTQLERFFALPDEVANPLMEAIKVIQEASAQQALKAYDVQIKEAQDQVENMTLERDAAIEAQRQALSDIETLNDTLFAREEHTRNIEKELERAQGRCESLDNQVDKIRSDANDKVAEAEAKIDTIAQQLNEARDHLTLADQRHVDTETRLVALFDEQKVLRENIEKDSTNKIDTLRNQLDSANDQVHTFQVATSRDQATLEAQRLSHERLASQTRALEQELKTKVGECAKLDATLANTKEALTLAAADKASLASELAQLKRDHDAVVIEKEVLKRELTNARKQKKASKRGGDT